MIYLNSFYRVHIFDRKYLSRIYGDGAQDAETLMLVSDDLDALKKMNISVLGRVEFPVILDYVGEFIEHEPRWKALILSGYERTFTEAWKAAVKMNREYCKDGSKFGRSRIDTYIHECEEYKKEVDDLFETLGKEEEDNGKTISAGGSES